MNADKLMEKIFEYSSTINNCCAFVKECVYTGKCAIDDDIVGCSDRDVFKKVKEALELRESLIRCKDCKWFLPNDSGKDGWCSFSQHGYPHADDYCSDAERRTE